LCLVSTYNSLYIFILGGKKLFQFWCYIFAISFQVAGALQLLVSFVSTKRDNVIKRFAGKGFISRDGNTKKVLYDKSSFLAEFKTAWLSKIAFGFIAIGYLIGIWGNIEDDKKISAFFLIAAITAMVLFLSHFIVHIYITRSKRINADITNDELERLKIQPALETISDSEIADLLD